MLPLPLNDRLDRVAQHVIRARLFLDLWFYFESQDTRPQILATMEDYNDFFRFTPHACLLSYVIYIAGAFEKRTDTINFRQLTREVTQAGGNATNIDALMTAAEPIVAKVAILRHKAFAHRDAHITYNDVFKLAAVKPDQLRELTEIALKIANSLLLARGLKDQYFNEVAREAAEQMMRALSICRAS